MDHFFQKMSSQAEALKTFQLCFDQNVQKFWHILESTYGVTIQLKPL